MDWGLTSMRRLLRSGAAGFTLVEMAVIAPIVILTIGIFITVIINMSGDVLVTRYSSKMMYDIQDTLNRMETDIKQSAGFLATNSVAITTPQGFNNDTTAFANVGANGPMLVLNMIATSGNPLASSSGIVYQANTPNSCGSPLLDRNTPISYNIVYFVKDGSLWRRVLMPSNYLSVGCNTPWQQASCYPGASGAICAAEDAKVLEGAATSDVTIGYYVSAASTASDAVASDSGSSASARQTALNGLSTAEISLTARKNVAGRDLSQTGSIRVTRLDTNASSLVPVTPSTIPARPTVVAAIEQATPNTATFSWERVPGATSYSVEYRINNSGSWTTGFTNQNATSYSVNASRKDDVQARVTANSGAGSSSYGTQTTKIPAWNGLVLNNDWTQHSSGYGNAQFTKTSAGVVVLTGLVKNLGTVTGSNSLPCPAGSRIAMLPPGYRPMQNITFDVETYSDTYGRINVGTDGALCLSIGTANWLSLTGIQFLANDGTYTQQTPSLLNGWTNFGGSWGTAKYAVDSLGRVFVDGVINAGTTTDNTAMVRLPANLAPSYYQHVPVITSAGLANAGLEYDTGYGDIEAKGLAVSWYSVALMYIPASAPNNWIAPTLLNGWVNYATSRQAPAGYYKGADDLVCLRGLVKSGTTTGNVALFNLPAGYRPAYTQLMSAGKTGNANVRININSGGDVTFMNGSASATWTTIDGQCFIADQ